MPSPRRAVVTLWSIALAALLSACSSSCAALFAPKARPLDSPAVAELREGQRSGDATFDHAAWDVLLRAHVREEQGTVDYAGLQADRAALEAYLAEVAAADLDALGRDEQLALLINAYNAYTLRLVLEGYPDLRSIKDLDDPWGARRHPVGGHTLSLDDIEHGLIRPLYRDPRIHFAVNCASRSCPPLAAEAYRGATLDAQLDRAARRTLADDRHARVEDGRLKLTRVMSWYGGDFVAADASPRADTVAAWAARYGDAEIAAFVEARGDDVPVDFLAYDWALNDVSR